MSSSIHIDAGLERKQTYKQVLPQLKSILESETDLIANMANFCAVIKEVFGFLWIGFYLVKKNELVLGPFQGPLACTRIAMGKGVCGTAWKDKKTIVVPDVDKFPGHIACSSKSKSEIVIPLFDQNKNVMAVLDIDSENLSDFDNTDVLYLSKMLEYLKHLI